MQLTPIFAHFMVEDNLVMDNDKIKKYCIGLKKKSSGRVISNLGGWQSDELKLAVPALQQLIEAVSGRLVDLNVALGFEPSNMRLSNYWININNTHDSNIPHCHPRSFFSAVYYVCGGEDKGDIVFINPFPCLDGLMISNTIKTYTVFNSIQWIHKPVTGKLLIFPSWLMHYVKPNNTNEDRISIAMNFVL